MPRRKTRSVTLPVLGSLILSALALFALAEGYRLARSDAGLLWLARHVGLGDDARVTRIVAKSLHEALDRAGVPRDSLTEQTTPGARAGVVWRLGLAPDASLLQLNYVVTRTLESQGAVVLRGEEGWSDRGIPTLRLLVGLPRRATHDLRVVRNLEAGGRRPEGSARVSVVLFGFGESAAGADSFFALPIPFGVALAATNRESRPMLRFAHARGREVVLHLPLEPIHYPQVNPGPGTLLVTMKPARIASDVRRHLARAAPVSAVANHMGSLATQDMTVMRAIFRELRRGQLPFLHVTPVAGSVCRPLAAELGVEYVEPDVVVDQEARAGPAALEKRWKEALREARDRGRLIVWMRATALTREWLPRALAPERLGSIEIVPLSSLIRKPQPL